MPVAGPNPPTTGADDAAVGSIGWANPGAVTASDDTYAQTGSSPGGGTTHYLKATDFGLAVPGTATIDGIKFGIERQGLGSVTDSEVKSVQGGVIGGNNLSAGATWAGGDQLDEFGGPTEKWGRTWTPADVNASGFGCALSAVVGSFATGKVDQVLATVWYTDSGGAPGVARAVACVVSQPVCPAFFE